MVHTSAPGKLVLFGEHVGRHGKPVVVFAVDKRIHIRLKERKDSGIYLTAKPLGVENEKYPTQKLDFISVTIKNFFEKTGKKGGFDLDATQEGTITGFGSSGASVVATLGALNELFKARLTKDEMLELGIKIEREASDVGSGLDIAPALWGGLILYQKGVGARQIKYKGFPIVVGNTGVKVKSGPIIEELTELEKTYPNIFNPIIEKIGELGKEAADAFEKNDLVRVGQLMNINHGLLYAEGVSSPVLEKLVWAAREAGAAGAKLSGAGRGDNMLALAPNKEKEVANAISKAGGTVMDVKIDKDGLVVHKS